MPGSVIPNAGIGMHTGCGQWDKVFIAVCGIGGAEGSSENNGVFLINEVTLLWT